MIIKKESGGSLNFKSYIFGIGIIKDNKYKVSFKDIKRILKAYKYSCNNFLGRVTYTNPDIGEDTVSVYRTGRGFSIGCKDYTESDVKKAIEYFKI